MDLAIFTSPSFILPYLFTFSLFKLGYTITQVGTLGHSNTKMTLLRHFIDMSICCLTWPMLGYPLSFGNQSVTFISWSPSHDLDSSNMSKLLFFLLYSTVIHSITSCCTVERYGVLTYVINIVYINIFMYPIVLTWIDNGGWLSDLGVLDYSGVYGVHIMSGTVAWVSAVLLGCRLGRFDEKSGGVVYRQGVSVAVRYCGICITFIGFVLVNCLFVRNQGDVHVSMAKAGLFSIVTPSLSFLCSMIFTLLIENKIDMDQCMTSLLTACVVTTATCTYVSMIHMFFICVFTSLLSYFSSNIVTKYFMIDDPFDSISIHLVGGIFGVLYLGLFHEDKGLFIDGNIIFFLEQLLGIVVVVSTTGILQYLQLKILDKYVGGIRVEEPVELAGLDHIIKLHDNDEHEAVITLNDVWKSSSLHHQFKLYLKRHMQIENLYYLSAVKKLKLRCHSVDEPFKRMSAKIYKHYIETNSSWEINIPDDIRKTIHSNIKSPHYDIFDASYKTIYDNLESTFVFGFANSKEFKTYNETEEKKKPAPLSFIKQWFCFIPPNKIQNSKRKHKLSLGGYDSDNHEEMTISTVDQPEEKDSMSQYTYNQIDKTQTFEYHLNKTNDISPTSKLNQIAPATPTSSSKVELPPLNLEKQSNDKSDEGEKENTAFFTRYPSLSQDEAENSEENKQEEV